MSSKPSRGIGPVPDGLGESLSDFLGQLRRVALDVAGNRLTFGSGLRGAGTGDLGGGGGSGGGVVGAAPDPDLTAPPDVAGLAITAGFAQVMIEWDTPIYTQGRGNKRTIIYAVKMPVPAEGEDPNDPPTFPGEAGRVYEAPEFLSIVSLPSDLGIEWYVWAKFESNDGIKSVNPAGGINGVDAATGRIGTDDLGPLIIEAGNIKAGAITAAKFAAGLSPVTMVTTVPATKLTDTIFNTTDKKLYYWDGAAYALSVGGAASSINAADIVGLIAAAQIASLAAAQITGQLTNAQLAAIAAAKITGTLSDSQIADLSAAKLTGQITSTQITDGAISTPKLAAGSVTTAKLVANAVTANEIASGAITTVKLAANAVTANEITAGAVTTAKLAAGAVTATELSAGSVTTAKIVAGAITSTELATGSVTAGKVAALSITGAEIAAGSVNADRLTANTITAGQIQAGAISATELAANAVTATKIAANAIAVGTAAIQNGAIVNAMIANATIDNAKIANLDASKITAGTISASRITALGDLTVGGQIGIGSGGYINGNSAGFESGAGFFLNAQSFSVGQGGAYLSYSTATGTLKTGNITMSGLLYTPGKTNYDGGNGVMIGYSAGQSYLGVTSTASGSLKGMWISTSDGVLNVTGAVITGSTINSPTLDSFSCSIPGGTISVSGLSNGAANYGTRSVSVSGGKSPYTYAWGLRSFEADNATANVYLGGTATSTCGVSGRATNCFISAEVQVVVTDANGRTATSGISVFATHGTP